MILTADWLHAQATKGDGWTKAQLALLGIAWPPPGGWLKRSIGTEIDDATATAFAAASGDRCPRRRRERAKRQNQSRIDRFAQRLRDGPTRAEQQFRHLLDGACVWYVFQQSYVDRESGRGAIADFRIATVFGPVVVEIDGSSHRGREAYDARRTAWLEEIKRVKVLRISNDELRHNPLGVLEMILTLGPKRTG